ncbi:MAG: hypothetical protein EXR71_11440 [Myxococcales bacterium]|nr:hypothetical protein [Myxococcales bacterium]
MLILLAACTSQTIVTGDSHDDAETADTGDTSDTGPAPRDLDADGYPAGEDCMDLNADVHPGATEVFNGLDDDCDGVFDADGEWSGSAQVEATAIYEGERYAYSLRCPVTGQRTTLQFAWTMACTPDPDDALAQRLLGETLSATPVDATVALAAWSGDVRVASTNGWDTDAKGSAAWSTLSTASLEFSLSAASLSLSAEAALTRR